MIGTKKLLNFIVLKLQFNLTFYFHEFILGMWLSGSWFPGGQCSYVCNNCSDQPQGGEELALLK